MNRNMEGSCRNIQKRHFDGCLHKWIANEDSIHKLRQVTNAQRVLAPKQRSEHRIDNMLSPGLSFAAPGRRDGSLAIAGQSVIGLDLYGHIVRLGMLSGSADNREA